MGALGEAHEGDSVIQGFLERLPFAPDRFQLDAFTAIAEDRNVIVAAPTGAGKTLAAEFAVTKALASGQRLFYTTPIKALSNQKFRDLGREHGAQSVGLLTGDNAINGDADAVVMTTEVLRNMLYAGNPLPRLQTVVLDEVHYLQDAYRGPVWEEVIIHLPQSVRLVCLSATVSNAEELADWVRTVRGPTDLVVEQRRPVQLTNFYMAADRKGSHVHTMRVLQGAKPNPKGSRFDHDPRSAQRRRGGGDRGRQKGGSGTKYRPPTRVEVATQLRQRDQLPAIYFIFSRAGCDDAAKAVVDAGVVLTGKAEQAEIRQILRDHIATLSTEALEVLDIKRFAAGLKAGVAAHHAGMVPPLKEAVEACFVRGLVKLVFATETLALGINMPARTVVLEKLTKFTGETHEFLTPSQYTQLTGRAGRRGIDANGQAVVLWSPWVRFEQIADLVTSKQFVLRSAFRPTYNMAANLMRRYEYARARQLLNQSFAQFRSDANVVTGERRVESLLQRKKQLIGELESNYGPLADLRAAFGTEAVGTRDEQAIAFALGHLHPGDIVELISAELPRRMVVVSVSFRKGGRVRAKGVDADGDAHEIDVARLETAPSVVGNVELPEPYLPNSVSFLWEVGQTLSGSRLVKATRRNMAKDQSIALTRDELPGPVLKGLKRLDKLERDLARHQRHASRRSDSLADQFDRVIELLRRRGHAIIDDDAPWELTPTGQRIARLYHESDLLIVESLDQGLFDGLSGPEVAALASVFVYEERRSNGPRLEPWYPSREIRHRYRRIQATHLDLVQDESDLSLSSTREPDDGFMAIAHGWASGGGLGDVLADEALTPGDFVRTARQLLDLLRQIAKLAERQETAASAAQAADAIHRDLVSASSLEITDADHELP